MWSTSRDMLLKRFADAQSPVSIHYPMPLNEQPAYKTLCRSNPTPIAHQNANMVISLPISPDLSEKDQNQIINVLAT